MQARLQWTSTNTGNSVYQNGLPSSDNTSSSDETEQSRGRNDGIDNSDSNISNSSSPSPVVPPTAGNSASATLEPLGISIAKPKYPQYAVLATRLSSFNSWPTDNGQRAEELAKAGFVYEGIYIKYIYSSDMVIHVDLVSKHIYLVYIGNITTTFLIPQVSTILLGVSFALEACGTGNPTITHGSNTLAGMKTVCSCGSARERSL